MRFTVDDQEYEFAEDTFLNTEAIKIQRATGYKLREFFDSIKEMDALALTALVWITWARNDRDVPFEDVVFDLTTVEIINDGETGPSEPSAT